MDIGKLFHMGDVSNLSAIWVMTVSVAHNIRKVLKVGTELVVRLLMYFQTELKTNVKSHTNVIR